MDGTRSRGGSPAAARRFAWLGSALLLTATPASADAIDTNRPGFSFTPGVVGQGRWQVETGLGYARNSSDSETISLPNAEFRYGTGENVEVFLRISRGTLVLSRSSCRRSAGPRTIPPAARHRA